MFAEIHRPLKIEKINRDTIVILVDILRASSTITTILSNLAKSVITVKTVEEAMKYRNKEEILIAGERNGYKIKSFDFGNSPLEFTRERIRDKDIVITTSNFSKAASKYKNTENVVILSSLNFKAVIDWILSSSFNKAIIVPAGKQGYPSIEDDYISTIAKRCIEHNTVYPLKREILYEILKASPHGRHLISIGHSKDLEYISQPNIFNIVPKRNKKRDIFQIIS